MIGIVTTSEELHEALKTPPFARLQVDCRLADSGAAVLAALEQECPSLVVVHERLADMAGLELCRRVRARAEWKRVRLMLAVTREELDDDLGREAAAVGCDDVLEMPASRQQIYDQIARLLRLPRRLARRINVDLVTEVEDLDRKREPVGDRRRFLRSGLLSALGGSPKGATLTGRVVDISEKGARLLLERRPAVAMGDRVRLSLASPIDGEDMAIDGRIAWIGERRDGPGYPLGIQFDHLRKEERLIIRRLIQWDLVEEPDGTRVVFYGEVVEETEFGQLSALLYGKVLFDLAGVRYLNSRGILAWTRFLEGLTDVTEYSFVNCSTAFVLQASFTPAMLGKGRIASFWLPVICSRCEREDQTLVEVADFHTLEGFLDKLAPCRCGGKMALDELPERMLAFLGEHTAAQALGRS